ncbi:MAG: DinB family protein [Chloroflexota bacterium]
MDAWLINWLFRRLGLKVCWAVFLTIKCAGNPARMIGLCLGVINHLYDEEREDFRTRLDILLHRPDAPMPPIHPGQWVTERAYNNRDPGESLANFLIERERSIAWLRELENPDWDQAATTPNGRPFHAGDMAASWAAHDLLHLRQLIELHWAWNLQASEPYNVEYAGDW